MSKLLLRGKAEFLLLVKYLRFALYCSLAVGKFNVPFPALDFHLLKISDEDFLCVFSCLEGSSRGDFLIRSDPGKHSPETTGPQRLLESCLVQWKLQRVASAHSQQL